MKLYEQRNNKSTIQCGYCNHEGHNKRNCPTLRRHWEANKDWNPRTMMCSALKDVNGADFWGGWYKVTDQDARRTFGRHFQYIDDIMTSPKTTPKKRKASRCGFCGSKRHTRRNCSLMGKFVKILEETNMAYREKFYEEVFVKTGLGIGAFVEIQQYYYMHGNSANTTSIITDIDFDSISIGNRFNRWSDWATALIVKVMIGDRERSLGGDLFLSTSFPLLERKWTGHLTNDYEGITKVIVPAPSIPDKDWFLGQSPAFDWVVKKKDLATLFTAYQGLIKLYHPEGEAIIEKWRKKV